MGRGSVGGFTLVEIMVALALIAVVSAVALLRVPTENRQLAVEASRVIAALELLSQQAIVRGAPHALEIAGPDYRLREFRHGAWVEKTLPGVAAVRTLPSPIRLEIAADAHTGTRQRRIVMLPSGEFNVGGFRLTDTGSGDAVSYSLNDYGRFELTR